ncbi:MAG: DUF1634 domain-containing protein [Candidatus Limnocylindrales bacterium]
MSHVADGERRTATVVARLLDVGARAAFVLVLLGMLLMLLAGIEPRPEPSPPPTVGGWLASLLALEPQAFIWAGIVLTVILPAATVVAAAIGFGRVGDRRGAITAAAVLVALSVALVVAVWTR